MDKNTQHPVDKGPWRHGITKDMKPRVFVESDDFTHDVRLYVDGDFADTAERVAYAKGIAQQLNAAQQPDSAQPVAQQAEPSREWFDYFIEDVSAIDCMYRGDPTYEHDAYWMKDRVITMLKKRRASIADRYASQVQPDSNCKFPLCQNEQYQQDMADALHRELYAGQPEPVNQQTLAALKVAHRIMRTYVDHYQDGHADYERNVAAIAAAEAAQPVGDKTWFDGYPPFPQDQEWFIAITTYGDRVVLRALDKDYSSYQYTTADHAYIKKESIAHWMQFPDCEYLPPKTPQPASAQPVAWCELNGKGEIAYFDGKPIFMPGAVGNECHPVPLFAAQPVAVPDGYVLAPKKVSVSMACAWKDNMDAKAGIQAMWDAMLSAAKKPEGGE